MKFRKMEQSKGIGLYNREEEKNTTPFQYFAQIVGGVVVFLCGALYLIIIFGLRHKETVQFGSAEPHLYGFAIASATIVVGIFIAHAGVIFWGRRFRQRFTKRHQRQHS
jgi:biotin transporter BioY